MNVLPVVIAFLILFSLFTLSSIRQELRSTFSESSIHSFYKTERVLLNSMANRDYKKAKSAPVPSSSQQISDPKSNTEKPTRKYHSKRKFTPPMENSKLNLLALLELQTDPKNHPLYEIAADFFRLLYEDSLFKQIKREGLEYEMLNALLKAYAANKKCQELHDLYPADPELRSIFYRMLKGTNHYDMENRKGIPPLEDFFSLEKTPAIHFAFASPFLLEALLGKKNTAKILTQEEKNYQTTGKNASLSQDELTALLASDPIHNMLVSELGENISFSQKFSKRRIISGQDRTSQLVIRKKI
jgi:hypothetical protein